MCYRLRTSALVSVKLVLQPCRHQPTLQNHRYGLLYHAVCLLLPSFCWVLTEPTHGGMAEAEQTWVRGFAPRWYTRHKTVTHPRTNRALRRVTTLIETDALPLSQAGNQEQRTSPRDPVQVVLPGEFNGTISELLTTCYKRFMTTVLPYCCMVTDIIMKLQTLITSAIKRDNLPAITSFTFTFTFIIIQRQVIILAQCYCIVLEQ